MLGRRIEDKATRMRTIKPARIFAVGLVVVGLGPLILGVGPAAADSHGRGGSSHQPKVRSRSNGTVPSGSTGHDGSGDHHHFHLTPAERDCLAALGVTLMAGRPHHHAKLDAATRAAFRAALVACEVIPADPVVPPPPPPPPPPDPPVVPTIDQPAPTGGPISAN